MEIEGLNQMEKSGANRRVMKSILLNDRKMVSRLIMQAAISVLHRDFNFNQDELNEFHTKIQAEIDQMR